MSIETIIAEVRTALESLDYDLNKHTARIVIRPELTPNQYEIRLDDKYFGIWDAERKTFVD